MNHDDQDPAVDPGLRALSAYLDDELPESERAAVRERLVQDPQAAAQLAAWRAQDAALRALCAAPATNPAREPACIVVRQRAPWWRQAALAACSLAAGAGLALLLGPLAPRLAERGNLPPIALARRADIAYAVYTPEQRHPVEVDASQQGHLIAWLSKRLNRKLSAPSLQEYGYTLVGGRLLPDASGPAAQFMYENDAGRRLTLYMTAVPKDETAYRSFRDGNRHTYYWVNDYMGYALSGPNTEGKLREIAADVCGALGGRPETWE